MMSELNDNITKSELVIFAGAGASAHLGYKVGSDFLQKLKTQFDVDKTAVGELWRLMSQREYPNFEYLYECSEHLCETLGLVPAGHAGTQTVTVSQSQQVPEKLQVYHAEKWRYASGAVRPAADLLRSELRRLIIKEYGQLISLAKFRQSPWRTLINSLHPGGGKVLTVFTTNYDVAFEDLAGFLTDDELQMRFGFEPEAPVRVQRVLIVPDKYGQIPHTTEERAVAVFKLHGCAAWRYIEDEDASEDVVAEMMLGSEGRPDADPDQAAVIWPSPSKVPFDRHFWWAHVYLMECLRSARVAAFIGYGFNDEALVHLIGYAVGKNPDLRILLCDTSENIREKAIKAGLPQEKIEDPFVGKFEDTYSEIAQAVKEHLAQDRAHCVLSLAEAAWPGLSSDDWKKAGEAGLLDTSNAKYTLGDKGISLRDNSVQREFQFMRLPFTGGDRYALALELSRQGGAGKGWGGVGLGWKGLGEPFVAVMKEGNEIRAKHMTGKTNTAKKDISLMSPIPAADEQWHELRIEREESGVSIMVMDQTGKEIGRRRFSVDPNLLDGQMGLVTSELPHAVNYRNIRFVPVESA